MLALIGKLDYVDVQRGELCVGLICRSLRLVSLYKSDIYIIEVTTKQACRDTYVVTCFLPSTIRILALLYVLSTVLRISSSNLLYYRSKYIF